MQFKVGDVVSSINGPYDWEMQLEVIATNPENTKICIKDPTTGKPQWWKNDYFMLSKDIK